MRENDSQRRSKPRAAFDYDLRCGAAPNACRREFRMRCEFTGPANKEKLRTLQMRAAGVSVVIQLTDTG